MAKKIQHSDLIENNLFTTTIEEAKALNIVLNATEQQFKDVLKVTALLKAENLKTQKGIADFTTATNKSRQAVQGLETVQQQRSKVAQQLAASTDEEIKGKLRLQRVNKEQRDALKAEIILTDKLAGTEEKLLATNTKLRLERAKLNTTTKQGQTRLKEINAALDRNNALIDKNSDKLKKQKRNVGNYRDALKGVGSALSSLGLAVGAGALVKNIFGIFSGFEQEGANLASVLGKSRDQIQGLTEDAKRLGATTAFTAGEVTQLQTEFAKLGFNQQQILDATEATLDLAAATGTDLSEAAAVAGATLGGFGLSADQTGRVADVMAKSFSTSALDMEKFKEAMKGAAPAAKAVGLSVEETTAHLGTLANAGISGSKAGNNLKTSLINLNAAGLTLEQGLRKVANSEDKLGTATKLVGKNAAASFLVLSEGAEATKELTKGLNNAGGAAKKMADTQLDTLSGKIKILTSAWEGFILSLDDGDGILAKVVGTAIELFTELFTLMSGGAKTTSDLEAEQRKLDKEFARSIDVLKRANTPVAVRAKLIEEINAKYGEYLPNLITEKTTTEELNAIQATYNKHAAERLRLAKAQLVQDILTESSKKSLRLIVALEMDDISQLTYLEQIQYKFAFDNEDARALAISRFTTQYQRQQDILENLTAATEKYKDTLPTGTPIIGAAGEDSADSPTKTKSSKKDSYDFADGMSDYDKFVEESKQATRDYNEFLRQQDDIALAEYDAFIQKDKDLRDERMANDERWYNESEKWRKIDADEKKKIDDKALEDAKAAHEKELELRKQIIDAAIDFTDDILKKRSAERIELLDKELAANILFQQSLQELAAKGVVNAQENLAFEKKKQAELELLKKQEIEKAAKQELALLAIKTYSGYVQQGNGGGKALAKTVTDIELLKTFIGTLDLFYEGTENTGTVGNPLDSNGGRLAVLHDNERVMTAEQNKKVSGLTNWELANLGADYKKGEAQVNQALNVQRFQSNEEVLKKFDNLEKAVKNSTQNTSFHYDSIKHAIVKTIESNNKISRTIEKKSKLF